MLGMTLAARLAARGHHVTLLEGAPNLGGLAEPARLGDVTWDRFYHVTLLSDLHLRGVLDELGLGDRLRWKTTRTGFYTDGTLYSLSSSLEFLMFPPLSLLDKMRLAGTILYASRVKDWRALEGVPVTDWLRKLSGNRVFTKIWEPLLRSKLGENYRVASASFIWAIIQRMYAARRSGLKTEMFGYVEGGYATVIGAFARHLEQLGVEVRTSTRVAEVAGAEHGATVRLEDGSFLDADAVVLTVPCRRVAAMVPSLTASERARLEGVVYQGIVCASVLLDQPLADFYVTNITDPGLPFTGVIEMTTLVDPATFGGKSLVYLPRYLTQDDPAWTRSDDALREEFLGGLERMYPAFRRDAVRACTISRVREVLAVTTLGYSARHLPPTRTSVPRVFVVNSAQIAQGTLNVNETIGLAEERAVEIAGELDVWTTQPVGI